MANEQEPDDAALLQRLAAGSAPRDLQALLARYADFLYSIALRTVGNPADAEDASQEAWMDILRSAGNYRPELGSVRAWLVTITVRRSRDQARRRARAAVQVRRAADIVPAEGEPEPHVMQEWVEAAVRALPESLREPILLRYYQGMPHREVAQALDRPEGTVRRQVAEGIGLLRDRMSRTGVAVSMGILVMTMRASPLYAMPSSLGARLTMVAAATGAGGALAGSVLPWMGGVLMKKTAMMLGVLCLTVLIGFGIHDWVRRTDSETRAGPSVAFASTPPHEGHRVGDRVLAQGDPIPPPPPTPQEAPGDGNEALPPHLRIQDAPPGCHRDRSGLAIQQSQEELMELFTALILYMDDFGKRPTDVVEFIEARLLSWDQIFCPCCETSKYVVVSFLENPTSPASILFAYDTLRFDGNHRVVVFYDGHTEVVPESTLSALLSKIPPSTFSPPPSAEAVRDARQRQAVLRAEMEQASALLHGDLSAAIQQGSTEAVLTVLEQFREWDVEIRDTALLWDAVRMSGREALPAWVLEMLVQKARVSQETGTLFDMVRSEDLSDANASALLSMMVWGLGDIPGFREHLRVLSTEVPAGRRDSLVLALSRLGDEEARTEVLGLYVSGDLDEGAEKDLVGRIHDYPMEQLQQYRESLEAIGYDPALPFKRRKPALCALLKLDPSTFAFSLIGFQSLSPGDRWSVVSWMGQILRQGGPSLRPYLEWIATEDPSAAIREVALEQLQIFGR